MDLPIDRQEAKLTATADIAVDIAAAREVVGSDRRLGFTFTLDIYLFIK